MKRRTLVLLTFSVGAALMGAGITYMTSFPEFGRTGVPRQPSPEIEQLAAKLEEHVRYQTIDVGKRNASHQGGSIEMVDYIVGHCLSLGLEPKELEYRADGRQQRNLVVEKKGRRPQVVLVGCHYDSYRATPCANAVGSGVAALLELIERTKNVPTDRTLRFVFFGSGEAPYRGTEEMGSRIYAKQCAESGDPIEDVLILDSIGYFTSLPGTQSFLPPWSLAYPKTGDFVAVIGTLGQRELVRRTLEAWGRATDVPARGGALPHMFAGIRDGDQMAFLAEGFDAVVLTDTGSNRYADNRTPFDNFARMDFVAFAHVVDGLVDAVIELAGR